MSSEMRELMQSVLDFVNRQPCRCMSIAQLGERDYCDRCQSVKNLRALLARTEAGADGAVAWRVEWDEDNDGDAFYVTLDTERGAMGRANEAIAEGFKGVQIRRLVYGDTHPQDASGDAEVLTAHGIKALDRCCGELRKFIELAGDYDLDEMSVQALETAIESMEMRKAAAMQAKEAK